MVVMIFAAVAGNAWSESPVVSHVTARQIPGTRLVEITYDLTGEESADLSVTVAISSDGGKTFNLIPTMLAGNIGAGVMPGTGKSILWDAGFDCPNRQGTQYQVRVAAELPAPTIAVQTVDDGYGVYVLVPAGVFPMGDNFSEGDEDERPVHTVSVDSFYIGMYEITNAEYRKFMEAGGYTNPVYWSAGGFDSTNTTSNFWSQDIFHGGGIAGNEKFPVCGITWYEAMAYCAWLSATTGRIYRLPTEAEWEKAARGSDQRRFAWGNHINPRYANYVDSGDPYDNSLAPAGFYNGRSYGGFVTQSNRSPCGVWDMTGNAWEWCLDWFDQEYYGVSPADNPAGPEQAEGFRVLRGGGWGYTIEHLRCANRSGAYPDHHSIGIGFRCVREP